MTDEDQPKTYVERIREGRRYTLLARRKRSNTRVFGDFQEVTVDDLDRWRTCAYSLLHLNATGWLPERGEAIPHLLGGQFSGQRAPQVGGDDTPGQG